MTAASEREQEILDRVQRLEELLQMLTGRVAAELGGHTIQAGTTTLVAGVSPAIAAVITASSRIFGFVKVMTPGAGNLTVEYGALAADRAIGSPGSFKITALLAAGTINNVDVSSIDWLVVN